MPTPGYRSEDRYSTGRRRVRDRGVEIGLGIGAGLIASVVLGIVLLSGVTTPGPGRSNGPIALASPAASGVSTFTLPSLTVPSGAPSPGSTGDEAPQGAATKPPSGGNADPADPADPPGAAGQTPKPVRTPRPQPTQPPPPPPTEPPPSPTEPPPPESQEPTPTPESTGPKRAVRDFYAAAEDHRWDAAIALWSPSMQANYPPQEFIVDRFIDTTRIDISSIATVERGNGRARVDVALTEHRLVEPSPRTIVGAWDLVKIDGVWLLDVPYF